jgi:hypothetical protein
MDAPIPGDHPPVTSVVIPPPAKLEQWFGPAAVEITTGPSVGDGTATTHKRSGLVANVAAVRQKQVEVGATVAPSSC